MASRRQKRVADLIREELGDLLQRKISDPRIEFATVSVVEVSPDLRQAHAYISVLGDSKAGQQALAGLNHAAGFIRRELASRLSLRHTPSLTFHLDDSLERGGRILDLLAQIGEEEANRDQDTP